METNNPYEHASKKRLPWHKPEVERLTVSLLLH